MKIDPGSARAMRRDGKRRLAVVLLLALPCLLCASDARAVDVSGLFSVFKTVTDNRGNTTDARDVQASVDLSQRISPYMRIRLTYQYFEFESETDLGASFFRRNRIPRVELTYNRPRMSGSLVAANSTTDGTAEDFEQKAFLANFRWQPVKGPGFALGFRDQLNVADPGVFGRDTHTRYYSAEAFYDRRWGGASYFFRRSELDNEDAAYSSVQTRHELRANARKPFLQNRVSLDFSGSVARLDRETQTDDTVDLAEPIPPSRGLFVIDTTPSVGELDPAPALIDGDLQTPAAPGIDIGGGNTFRNVGIDLGIKVQVTRLEITVDTVSSPNVNWEVYQSPDNLIWEPIGGVVSEFDVALLRYTLTFPQATEQYFKAVNTSANSQPLVWVTEIRALIDVTGPAGAESFESRLYRADLGVGFRASRRITGRASAGLSTDQDFAAGFVRRDFRTKYYAIRMVADLARDLQLTAGYRFNDIQNLRPPVLLRTESLLSAGLNWVPLPTVDTVLSVTQRDESQEGTLLQSDRSARLLVGLTIRPEVRLITDFTAVNVSQPVSDYSRVGWTLRESLMLNPATRWIFGVDYFLSEFESRTGPETLRTERIGANTTWAATSYLRMQGNWFVGRENDLVSFRQGYSISYIPGTRFTLSDGYQNYESDDIIGTTSSNLSLTYRLNRHFMIFGNFSRSSTTNQGLDTGEVTSLRLGLRALI